MGLAENLICTSGQVILTLDFCYLKKKERKKASNTTQGLLLNYIITPRKEDQTLIIMLVFHGELEYLSPSSSDLRHEREMKLAAPIIMPSLWA